MINRKFQRLIRRYAGEGGGGAAPETTVADPTPTAGAEPVTPVVEPAKPFKAFTSQADYDREIQQAIKSHEAKLTAKLTPAIKAQLEKEANMTAEQKLQAEKDALEADRKALATEKSRIKAEALFAVKGIGEAERAVMLDRCVTDSEEDSVKNAQALLDAIDNAVKEQIKVAMKDVKPPNSVSTTAEKFTPDVAYAKDLADRRSKAAASSKNAIDFYLGGK